MILGQLPQAPQMILPRTRRLPETRNRYPAGRYEVEADNPQFPLPWDRKCYQRYATLGPGGSRTYTYEEIACPPRRHYQRLPLQCRLQGPLVTDPDGSCSQKFSCKMPDGKTVWGSRRLDPINCPGAPSPGVVVPQPVPEPAPTPEPQPEATPPPGDTQPPIPGTPTVGVPAPGTAVPAGPFTWIYAPRIVVVPRPVVRRPFPAPGAKATVDAARTSKLLEMAEAALGTARLAILRGRRCGASARDRQLAQAAERCLAEAGSPARLQAALAELCQAKTNGRAALLSLQDISALEALASCVGTLGPAPSAASPGAPGGGDWLSALVGTLLPAAGAIAISA